MVRGGEWERKRGKKQRSSASKKERKKRAQARVCGWREIEYNGMKTKSYKLDLLTVIEWFHLTNRTQFYIVNRNP